MQKKRRSIENVELRITPPEIITTPKKEEEETRELGEGVGQTMNTLAKEEKEKEEPRKYREIDPVLIKKIQFRISHLEDFEDSLGITLQEIKERLAMMETTRKELEDMRKDHLIVEKTLRELASLYDLISGSVNPFIEAESERKLISEQMRRRGEKLITEKNKPKPEMVEKEEEIPLADVWVVKWGEFLLERIPKKRVPELLDHYEDIGWLDIDIRKKVESCVKSIDETSLGIRVHEIEKEVKEGRPSWWKLSIGDHAKSLEFIKKIRGTGTTEKK